MAPTPAPPTHLIVPSTKRYRRPRGTSSFLKGLFVFLLLASVASGVLYYYRDELVPLFAPAGVAEERKAFQTQGNFSLDVTGGWKQDKALQDRLRANLALSLKKPRGHMALYYRDYKTRAPSDGELLDFALKPLRDYFPQMEYEDPFSGDKKGRTGELGEEPAIVFTFSASDAADIPMRGKCLMLTRQGFAYWLLFWGPEDYQDQLVDHYEVLRQGFKLHDERDGWKPMPRKMDVFTGTALAYQLHYAKDVWRAEESPRDADSAAELLLRGFEPSIDEETGKARVIELAGKAAEIRVLVLPKAADLKAAIQATQDHIKKKLVETTPTVKIEPVPDRKTGKPIPGVEVGAFRGQVDRLRLELSPDNERYMRVGVVSRPEGVLAIVCECRWERRDYWEQEFKTLLATVRPSAAPKESASP
jgi:hypothetical protein